MLRQQDAVVIPDTDDECSDHGEGAEASLAEPVGEEASVTHGEMETTTQNFSERREMLNKFFAAHEKIERENATVIGGWDRLEVEADTQETQVWSVDEGLLSKMQALSMGPGVHVQGTGPQEAHLHDAAPPASCHSGPQAGQNLQPCCFVFNGMPWA